jgi:hypothetical protein
LQLVARIKAARANAELLERVGAGAFNVRLGPVQPGVGVGELVDGVIGPARCDRNRGADLGSRAVDPYTAAQRDGAGGRALGTGKDAHMADGTGRDRKRRKGKQLDGIIGAVVEYISAGIIRRADDVINIVPLVAGRAAGPRVTDGTVAGWQPIQRRHRLRLNAILS